MHGGVGIGDASYLVLVIDGSNTMSVLVLGVGPKAICYTDVLRDISSFIVCLTVQALDNKRCLPFQNCRNKVKVKQSQNVSSAVERYATQQPLCSHAALPTMDSWSLQFFNLSRHFCSLKMPGTYIQSLCISLREREKLEPIHKGDQ